MGWDSLDGLIMGPEVSDMDLAILGEVAPCERLAPLPDGDSEVDQGCLDPCLRLQGSPRASCGCQRLQRKSVEALRSSRDSPLRGRVRRGSRRWALLGAILVALLPTALASSPKDPKPPPTGSLGALGPDGARGNGTGDGEGGEDGEGWLTWLARKPKKPEKSPCGGPCGNGYCDGETAKCVCYPGWRGDGCSVCGGKIK